MRKLTCTVLLILWYTITSFAIFNPLDSNYVERLQQINDQIEENSLSKNYEGLAKAYYDRALHNFDVPLRNQDIIGDLIESARYYKYLKDDLGFYNARLALAEFYILEEIFLDEALELTAEAFRFYKEKGIKQKVIAATKQLGQIYHKKQEYEKAIPYVEQALSGSIEIEDHAAELDIRLTIIELFGKLGNVERVLEQGRYTLELSEAYDIYDYDPAILYIMATYLNKDGQTDKALLNAEAARDMASTDNQLNQNIYELLAVLYNSDGNMDAAYESLVEADRIKSYLYNQEKYALANQLAVKYQTYEKEREIRELVQDNELKEFRLTQRTRLFLILGSILLLLAGLALYLYRLQRQKLATKNLIAEQQEEISRQKITDLENSLKIKNLEAMVNGQEAERTRIATELHDSLGGMLSTLKLQYDSLQVDHDQLSHDPDYEKIMDLIDLACKDVRDIARNLKPNALENLGLSAALRDLVNRYSIRGVLEISLHVNDIDGYLNDDAKLHVYRIIQELLNNALKHAHASEIDVQVNKNDKEIFVMVEDNGTGFVIDEINKGLGLDNLQSRVSLLKGEMDIDSAPQRGTSVTVHIPLSDFIKEEISENPMVKMG